MGDMRRSPPPPGAAGLPALMSFVFPSRYIGSNRYIAGSAGSEVEMENPRFVGLFVIVRTK